ncbi:sulfurtransferase TusA [soil metagenome]
MPDATTRIEATEVLDCRGLLCPLPVYKAAVVLNRLAAGDVLELVATDPGSIEDVPALARQRGDVLLSADTSGATYRFWLEKGGER